MTQISLDPTFNASNAALLSVGKVRFRLTAVLLASIVTTAPDPKDFRRDWLLDSSGALLTAVTPFEFCATTARTGVISSRLFDIPTGGNGFRLIQIHRPRWVSHSGSVFVD